MTWFTTGEIEEFLTAAGSFLRSRPAENTVLLTVAETLRVRGSKAFGAVDPFYGWWRGGGGGGVDSAFLHTPPHPVLLTRSPANALTCLAELLAGLDRPLPGINLCDDAAGMFMTQWRRHTGLTPAVSRLTRLYRLGDLVPPHPAVPGSARVAVPADRDLLLEWYAQFEREIGEERSDHAGVVDDRIGHGGLTLWERNGIAVSMAGLSRTVAGVARVAPVYTPPELRQRGYASAVTAAVTQSALDAGATDVVLFTDLANPTSNSVYQRLGYRPVHDRVVLSFTGG